MILAIWEKRGTLPVEARPFGSIERVLKSIVALRSEGPHFGLPFTTGAEEPASPWLKFAARCRIVATELIEAAIIGSLIEEGVFHEQKRIADAADLVSADESEMSTVLDQWLQAFEVRGQDGEKVKYCSLAEHERTSTALHHIEMTIGALQEAVELLKSNVE